MRVSWRILWWSLREWVRQYVHRDGLYFSFGEIRRLFTDAMDGEADDA